MVRYRFSDFTLSPQRRILVQNGREVPLIPRYFDLLLLLIERRQQAVHRQEIFDRVWGDVTVSESALSQAVRTIRRTLGDDSREPRFIRTVSRHGYRFVFPEVIEEEEDEVAWPATGHGLQAGAADGEERHEEADKARAAVSAATHASAGGTLAGVVAGGLGGLILAAAPGSAAPFALVPVLAAVGAGCGAIGGAGVGAGLGLAAGAARAPRALASALGAALGGGLVGFVVQWMTRWALAGLVGLDVKIGGGLEGIVIGGAAGLAMGIAAPTDGIGPAAAGYRMRRQAPAITAVACGMAGLALSLGGHPLAGGTIHAIADAAEGSRATLAPLGRLIGEPDLGPVSRAILAFAEAATFGLGLALGLMRWTTADRGPDFREI